MLTDDGQRATDDKNPIISLEELMTERPYISFKKETSEQPLHVSKCH